MLEQKTNTELIESVIGNEAATGAELELADRLQAAIHELDRMTQALTMLEAASGKDA